MAESATRYAVVVKRAREVGSSDDGTRVLVDRLWLRGLTRERVAADLWLRDVTLIHDASNAQLNHAIVLRRVLDERRFTRALLSRA